MYRVKELQQEKDNIFEKPLSGFKSRTLKIQTEYSSVAANIDRVVNVLENHMIELRQSLATMERSTIQSINKSLVDTIAGVYEISKRAQQERADKEKRLLSYEAELKNVLVMK